MKKVYISFFILFLIAALTFTAYLYTKNLSEDLTGRLEKAQNHFISENYDMAFEEIVSLNWEFDKNIDILALLVHMDELTDIKDSYSLLLIYCNRECYYDFLSQIEISKSRTTDFFDGQKISHLNIL